MSTRQQLDEVARVLRAGLGEPENQWQHRVAAMQQLVRVATRHGAGDGATGGAARKRREMVCGAVDRLVPQLEVQLGDSRPVVARQASELVSRLAEALVRSLPPVPLPLPPSRAAAAAAAASKTENTGRRCAAAALLTGRGAAAACTPGRCWWRGGLPCGCASGGGGGRGSCAAGNA